MYHHEEYVGKKLKVLQVSSKDDEKHAIGNWRNVGPYYNVAEYLAVLDSVIGWKAELVSIN